MIRPALVVALGLALTGCRSSAPVFVCPVGGGPWGENRLTVTVLAARSGPGGVVVEGRVGDVAFPDPLPGVSVVVNDARGTVTDADGRFLLDGLRPGDAVRFSFVGYAPFVLSGADLAGSG